VSQTNIPKTDITNSFGLWEFTRKTFGMQNSGNTFQQLMEPIMVDLDLPYIDDIFVFSRGEE
jgi:hypothetical protein